MKIANVVIDANIKLNNKFNVVDSLDKIIEDKPTLVIGLDNAKKINIPLDFLDRKINNSLYWTFSKKEKRLFFEEDLYFFQKEVYNQLKEKNVYTFIDFILDPKESINDFLNYVKNKKNIITYKNKNMLYLLFDFTIFGVDLEQLRYLGKDNTNTLTFFKNNSKVFLEDENILIKYNNDLEMFNFEVKYIPLIYKINKNE